MTKDQVRSTEEALKLALEACPFCGGEAEYQTENVRSGYGEYERNETYHTIRCKKCGASSKRVHQKHLIDFTKYTVRDFRENPILRAKVEDDYDAYCEQSKQLAIDAWSLRTAIKQALNDATHLAAPVQEPVEWEAIAADQAMTIALLKSEAIAAQRQWVGLTDEEHEEAVEVCLHIGVEGLVFWLDDKLKEKNSD